MDDCDRRADAVHVTGTEVFGRGSLKMENSTFFELGPTFDSFRVSAIAFEIKVYPKH